MEALYHPGNKLGLNLKNFKIYRDDIAISKAHYDNTENSVKTLK